jgi:hypothetical protein
MLTVFDDACSDLFLQAIWELADDPIMFFRRLPWSAVFAALTRYLVGSVEPMD